MEVGRGSPVGVGVAQWRWEGGARLGWGSPVEVGGSSPVGVGVALWRWEGVARLGWG